MTVLNDKVVPAFCEQDIFFIYATLLKCLVVRKFYQGAIGHNISWSKIEEYTFQDHGSIREPCCYSLVVYIHDIKKWVSLKFLDKDEPDAQHLNDEKSRLFIVPGITSVDEISALRMILNCDNLEEITMQAP